MRTVKINYNNEIISGGIFAIISAILWFLIPSQIQTAEKSVINATTVPQIAIGGLFVFSVCLFIQGIRLPKKTVSINKEAFSSIGFRKELRTLIFALMLILYGILFGIIGYILDTILLVVGILMFYKSKKWLYYVIAIVTVFIIYGVFTYFLNVNLPNLF